MPERRCSANDMPSTVIIDLPKRRRGQPLPLTKFSDGQFDGTDRSNNYAFNRVIGVEDRIHMREAFKSYWALKHLFVLIPYMPVK